MGIKFSTTGDGQGVLVDVDELGAVTVTAQPAGAAQCFRSGHDRLDQRNVRAP